MRKLTAKQKKALKEYRSNGGDAYSVETLPYELWEKLENINNTEILWSEVNRWLWDNKQDAQYSHIIF